MNPKYPVGRICQVSYVRTGSIQETMCQTDERKTKCKTTEIFHVTNHYFEQTTVEYSLIPNGDSWDVPTSNIPNYTRWTPNLPCRIYCVKHHRYRDGQIEPTIFRKRCKAVTISVEQYTEKVEAPIKKEWIHLEI